MTISDILDAKEGNKEIMGDILRTLYLFSGTLWLPELIAEMDGFKRTLQEATVNEEAVKKALQLLSGMGFVALKPGIRATFSRHGEETVLIALVRDPQILDALSRDRKVVEYRRIWREATRAFR